MNTIHWLIGSQLRNPQKQVTEVSRVRDGDPRSVALPAAAGGSGSGARSSGMGVEKGEDLGDVDGFGEVLPSAGVE